MSERTKTISRNEYIALHGLRALLVQNQQEEKRLFDAIAAIVGEEKSPYGGYDLIGDWAYSSSDGVSTVEKLLETFELKVETTGPVSPDETVRIEKGGR